MWILAARHPRGGVGCATLRANCRRRRRTGIEWNIKVLLGLKCSCQSEDLKLGLESGFFYSPSQGVHVSPNLIDLGHVDRGLSLGIVLRDSGQPSASGLSSGSSWWNS